MDHFSLGLGSLIFDRVGLSNRVDKDSSVLKIYEVGDRVFGFFKGITRIAGKSVLNVAAQGSKKMAQLLPRLKGKSVSYIQQKLSEFGFVRTQISSGPTAREVWRHADGSEVRVDKYGNLNRSPWKSGNNAHVHKEIPAEGNIQLRSTKLNDRGFPTADKAEQHIGIRNPKDLAQRMGRPHGDGKS